MYSCAVCAHTTEYLGVIGVTNETFTSLHHATVRALSTVLHPLHLMRCSSLIIITLPCTVFAATLALAKSPPSLHSPSPSVPVRPRPSSLSLIRRVRGGVIPLLAPLFGAAAPATAAAATAATTGQLVDCVAGAGAFFGNVRLPAVLLTGAAIPQLFVKIDGHERGKWVQCVYTILMSTALCFEIAVIFIATASATRLLGGGFDRMATDPIAFLVREFEFAYLGCRFQFFAGVLTFTFGLALRAWAVFPGSLGSGIALGILANTFSVLTYFNSTVLHYRFGLLGLGLRFFALASQRMGPTPVGAATLLTSAGAYYFIFQAVREAIASDESTRA